jgi:radical SAM-linked protein
MGRLWERLLRRAGIPITYTQGYNPHPRLRFAAALPVGYSSSCELVGVLLAERVAPGEFLNQTRAQQPTGLDIYCAEQVPIKAAALQSKMRRAEYEVQLWLQGEPADVRQALHDFLARSSIMRQRTKKGRKVDYDLRSLVHDLGYKGCIGACHDLSMLLRCGSRGSGRPEEIIDELGLSVERYAIRRTKLIWDAGKEE